MGGDAESAQRPRWMVVSALGSAQILAWGSSYYLISVLAKPIADATGWTLSWIVGGLSIGFLVSGLVSPKVGRLIEHYGGRQVLAGSAVLLSVGLLLLALAPNIPVFVAAWCILGVAMGAGLYDPAFSTLGRIYGEHARGAITQVTLLGGFASTVCWPLSAFLVEHIGWRGACATYAAIHLFVTLPLYWFGLPQETPRPPPAPHEVASQTNVRADHRIVFALLSAGLTLASVLMTVISIHLLTILQSRGVALAEAVALGALLGPAQVGARVVESFIGRNVHPIWSMLASTLLVVGGLVLLVLAPALALPGIAGIAIVLYGSGSGIRSIVRGTVPLALFGREGYAVLMGKLAMPTLIAQAAAPALGAVMLDRLGTTITLEILVIAAIGNVIAVLLLVPFARRRVRAG